MATELALARPSVSIGGQPIPSSWTGHELVGLESVEIPWGRSKLYDKPKPAVLTLSVIDPIGTWAAGIADAASEVIVHTATDLGAPPQPGVSPIVRIVHFRGAIESATITPVYLENPATGETDQVWRVEIVAVDPLGALGGARPAGPYWNTQEEAYGIWPNANMPERFTALRNAGVNAIAPRVWQPPGTLVMGGHSSGTSLLDLIDAAYSTVAPFARAQYDPNDGTPAAEGELPPGGIRPGGLAATEGMTLFWDFTTFTVGARSDSATNVDSALVELPGTLSVKASSAESIDSVKLVYKAAALDKPEDGFARRLSASKRIGTATTATERTLEYQADFVQNLAGEPAAAALLTELAKVVAQMNGRMTPPPVRFSEKRLRAAAPSAPAQLGAWWVALFVPATSPRAFYFPGNRYARLGTMPAGYQIIGGTIRFDANGWTAEATLAPARFTGAPIKVGELSIPTISGLPLNRFAPGIRLADFQYIKKASS